MLNNQFVSVIISAAGAGTRMGTDGKMHLTIRGESVLSRTLRKFAPVAWIDELILVHRAKETEAVQALVDAIGFSFPVHLVPGGAERHDSVGNGLDRLHPDSAIVLTHDGARPFVTVDVIEQVARGVLTHPAVAVAVPMTDTVKIVREDLSVVATPDRNTLWRVQTPQGFQTKVLKKAYARAAKEKITGTDDCSIVEKLGVPVQLIPGADTNIKITTKADLHFGEGIASEEEQCE